MEEICAKELCTACAACMNVCGCKAISMEEVAPFGYVYPKVDKSRCIDCGLCVKICPVNAPSSLHEPIKAYAAISRNVEDLLSSTSGGASSVMVNHILHKGGVVYGCVQNNYKDIAHHRIDKVEDAYKLKNSKYVQSNIGLVYCEVKKDLTDGREVLFTGTPCQIAGLRNFLRKEYDNLFLVDLVCHGVPSQHLLIEDIDEILRRNGIQDDNYQVIFRKKTPCTSNDRLKYGIFLYQENSELILPEKYVAFLNDNYITAFMSGIIFRESCFSCPYAKGHRGSDITIADFWGLGDSSVPKENGVSLMMTSTLKGEKLVAEISSSCHIEERDVEEAIRGNGQLMAPSKCPKERADFFRIYPSSKDVAYKCSLKKYKSDYKRSQCKFHLMNVIRGCKPVYKLLYKIYKTIKK